VAGKENPEKEINLMITVHPQYITDTAGVQLVVLPLSEFKSMMQEIEEIEDVRLYDEAKANDTGERIAMEDAFRIIEGKRKKAE